MSEGPDSPLFMAFVVGWMALGIASWVFFAFNRNAALKRRVWPVVAVGTGALFVAIVWHMTSTPDVLVFMVLAVLVITLLNLRAAKFCGACGRTHWNQNPFGSVDFCSKCGARFEQ